MLRPHRSQFLSRFGHCVIADPPITTEIAASTFLHVYKHLEQVGGGFQIACRTGRLE